MQWSIFVENEISSVDRKQANYPTKYNREKNKKKKESKNTKACNQTVRSTLAISQIKDEYNKLKENTFFYIFDTQDDLKITREIEEFEILLENQSNCYHFVFRYTK